MEDFLRILIPAALAFGFLRLCMAQLKWFWKIGVNSLSGFLCLWLLNLISPWTHLVFPINLITAMIAGFLGIPGILLLGAVQIFL